MARKADEWIVLGRIRGVFGVKGALRVESYSDSTESILEHARFDRHLVALVLLEPTVEREIHLRLRAGRNVRVIDVLALRTRGVLNPGCRATRPVRVRAVRISDGRRKSPGRRPHLEIVNDLNRST